MERHRESPMCIHCKHRKKESFEFIQKYVEKLPSVKPQEKTGHWIYKTMEGQFCSICGEQSVWKFNYCPNCGAKMVEPQAESEVQE